MPQYCPRCALLCLLVLPLHSRLVTAFCILSTVAASLPVQLSMFVCSLGPANRRWARRPITNPVKPLVQAAPLFPAASLPPPLRSPAPPAAAPLICWRPAPFLERPPPLAPAAWLRLPGHVCHRWRRADGCGCRPQRHCSGLWLTTFRWYEGSKRSCCDMQMCVRNIDGSTGLVSGI